MYTKQRSSGAVLFFEIVYIRRLSFVRSRASDVGFLEATVGAGLSPGDEYPSVQLCASLDLRELDGGISNPASGRFFVGES